MFPLPRTCSYTLGLLGFIAGAWAAGYHPPTLSLHARSPAVLKQLLGRLAGSLGRQAQTWNAPSALPYAAVHHRCFSFKAYSTPADFNNCQSLLPTLNSLPPSRKAILPRIGNAFAKCLTWSLHMSTASGGAKLAASFRTCSPCQCTRSHPDLLLACCCGYHNRPVQADTC